MALYAALPAMEAVRMLRAIQMGQASVSPQGHYDLVLLATGDIEAAEKTYKARLHADLRAGRETG